MTVPPQVTIYDAERAGSGVLHVLRDCLLDLWRCRGLAWQLYVRDVKAQHRQTLLGFSWILLPPLATAAVWIFLRAQSVVVIDTGEIPYVAYVLVGMALWQGFADALQAPLAKVQDLKSVLSKVAFVREAIIVGGMLEVFTYCAARLLVFTVIVLLAAGAVFDAAPVPALAGVASLLLLGTALGVLLVPLGVLYQDVGRGLRLVSQFWLYLTPVIYLPPVTGPGTLVNWLNPVSPLLNATRDWLLHGASWWALPSLMYMLAAAVLLAGALVLFRISMPFLIERMGNQ
jgi:lipopolysaccharide transport system permease protein